MQIRLAVAAGFLLVFLGACTHLDSDTQTSAADNNALELLTHVDHWRLVELHGRPVTSGQRSPTLKFDNDGKRMSGFSGCNRYAGQFELGAKQELRFSRTVSTKMACMEPTVEDEFLQTLETVDSYHTDGISLSLHRARMRTLAIFEAVRPVAEMRQGE